MDLIEISSITHGLQGDGPLAGHPTVFVHTAGEGNSWTISPSAILNEAERLAGGPCLLTLTGSDPAAQPLGDLIQMAQVRGFTVACETDGTLAPEWLEDLDHLIVSPKPPSFGTATDFKALHEVLGAGLSGKPRLSLAVVVMDDPDFTYAEMIHELFPPIDFYVLVRRQEPSTPVRSDPFGVYGFVERASWIAQTILDRQQPDMRLSFDIQSILGGQHA